MDVCCSFKSIAEGNCGFDKRSRKQKTVIIPLLACSKRIDGHSTRSAFLLTGKIGFPGGKPNGTGLSNGNFSKKREYLQRYSSFLVFTGITGKSLYHLLYHTSAMLLGKSTRLRSRKWRPLLCFSVHHADFSV